LHRTIRPIHGDLWRRPAAAMWHVMRCFVEDRLTNCLECRHETQPLRCTCPSLGVARLPRDTAATTCPSGRAEGFSLTELDHNQQQLCIVDSRGQMGQRGSLARGITRLAARYLSQHVGWHCAPAPRNCSSRLLQPREAHSHTSSIELAAASGCRLGTSSTHGRIDSFCERLCTVSTYRVGARALSWHDADYSDS